MGDFAFAAFEDDEDRRGVAAPGERLRLRELRGLVEPAAVAEGGESERAPVCSSTDGGEAERRCSTKANRRHEFRVMRLSRAMTIFFSETLGNLSRARAHYGT